VTSLRLRLLLGAVGFILAALALAALGLTLLFREHVDNWVDGELKGYLDQVIAGIDVGPTGELIVLRPPTDPRFDQPFSGRYWEVLVEPSGSTLRSRSLWDYEIPLPTEENIGDELHRYRLAGPNDSRLYLLQRRIELPERLGRKTVRAAFAVDAAEVETAVRRFATALIPLLSVLGALLLLAAWVQVSVGLRPLSMIRRKLTEIGAGARKRLGGGFPAEVQPLAGEVDTLLDDRDKQIERTRARAADLAHALKTPLQVLLSDASALKDQGQTAISEEIESIATALQHHSERYLSRARRATYTAGASADVGQVAERVVRVVKRTPDGQRLTWTLDLPAGIRARIDAEDLAEAIGNLSENAARHARSQVAVSAQTDADSAILSLTDDGPGIPEALQDEVLKRGTRLDRSGPGTGLGLSIVKEIAEAWGAELSFQSGEDRFSVRLRLPLTGA
jgi:signal transduction histidine kinase